MNLGKRVVVPPEMLKLMETAKREYKSLTGKQKCSDPTALKYIAGASNIFKYKKFSFEEERDQK
jgi:hypothetical protein